MGPKTRSEKEKQIRREARATVMLFAFCLLWNVGFAFSGLNARVLGMPLWWLLSTPGVFVISVVGVIFLLKKVFVDFDLDDEEEGGSK